MRMNRLFNKQSHYFMDFLLAAFIVDENTIKKELVFF
jgi:hypothetical protein